MMIFTYIIEKMAKFGHAAIAILMITVSQAAEAAPQLFNLSSLSGSGISVPTLLTAGDYRITFASTSTGGAYDGWNPWNYTSGCDSKGEKCAQGWQSGYAIEATNLSGKIESVRVYSLNTTKGGPAYFSTPKASNTSYSIGPLYWTNEMNPSTFIPSEFNDVSSMGFSLKQDAHLRLFIPDSYYGDNAGGVSLLLDAGGPLDPKAPVFFNSEPPTVPAGIVVTYTGHTTEYYGQGLGDGNRDFIARYSYAADGSMQWASMKLAGLPFWRLDCPRYWVTARECRPLVLSPTEISSYDWWSVEDVAIASVSPRLPFDPLPWPNGKFVYNLKPGDGSYAMVGVSDFGDTCGYCWFTGTGVVERVTFGFGVPEPASWTMLIAGFGLTGASMRRRKAAIAA